MPTDLLDGSSVCAGAKAGASVGSTIPLGQHYPVNPHAAASTLLKLRGFARTIRIRVVEC